MQLATTNNKNFPQAKARNPCFRTPSFFVPRELMFFMLYDAVGMLEHGGECPSDARILKLTNKPPHWNEGLKCWCLNFKGRVKLASVKNFQLMCSNDATGRIVMQFGKVRKQSTQRRVFHLQCLTMLLLVCWRSCMSHLGSPCVVIAAESVWSIRSNF